MNIQKYENILVPLSEHQMHLEVHPFAAPLYRVNINPLVTREALVCKLLSNLKSFHDFMNEIRTKLEMKELIAYKTVITIEELVKFENLTEDQRKILDAEAEKILKRYKLGENFRMSIKAVILTHHLPIPYTSTPINLHFPTKPSEKSVESSNPKNLRDLTKGFGDKLREGIITDDLFIKAEVLKYPAIYFTSRTSSTNLITWIRTHKEAIDYINSLLPQETSVGSKIDERTEKIGAVAVILWQDGIKSWSKMAEKIDEWDKIPKDTYSNFFGEKGLPTAEDLRLGFESYMETLNRLDKISES